MSGNAIGAPSRKLDEFEELVYEYTARMGLGSEGSEPVSTPYHMQQHYICKSMTLHFPLHTTITHNCPDESSAYLFQKALGRRRPQL